MKKTIILIGFVVIFYMFSSSAVASSVKIPDDAIRIRVLANSNSDYDQKVKSMVRDDLEGTMYSLLKDARNSDEAREIITSHLDMVDSSVNDVLKKEKYNLGYSVDFGKHYFPSKEYKGVSYDEGYYESLLVTLGSGEGDNWWCVLFPPLCLIEGEESSDTEYKSFVQELIDKYF